MEGRRRVLESRVISRRRLEGQVADAAQVPFGTRGREERLAAMGIQMRNHPAREERVREELRTGHEGRQVQEEQLVCLLTLGVWIHDGNVFRHEAGIGRHLGLLAGAHAELTTAVTGHRRTGGQRFADASLVAVATGSPLGLLAGAYSRPVTSTVATITFADGTVPEKERVIRTRGRPVQCDGGGGSQGDHSGRQQDRRRAGAAGRAAPVRGAD